MLSELAAQNTAWTVLELWFRSIKFLGRERKSLREHSHGDGVLWQFKLERTHSPLTTSDRDNYRQLETVITNGVQYPGAMPDLMLSFHSLLHTCHLWRHWSKIGWWRNKTSEDIFGFCVQQGSFWTPWGNGPKSAKVLLLLQWLQAVREN